MKQLPDLGKSAPAVCPSPGLLIRSAPAARSSPTPFIRSAPAARSSPIPLLSLFAALSFAACSLVGCTACGGITATGDATDKMRAGDIVAPASMPANARGISLVAAESRALSFQVSTIGEVVANSNLLTRVNTPVSGRTEEVLVSVGDHVRHLQSLARIHSEDIEQAEADLLQNDAQVKADLKRDLLEIDSDISLTKAHLRLSESTFNRVKGLVDEKIASRAEFEQAKTE